MPSTPFDASSLFASPQPRRVLVTGATGFVGPKVVEALRLGGHQVSVWTRDVKAAQKRLGASVRCVQRLQDLPADALPDAVINLAGARIVGPRWTEHRKKVLLDSRVALTRELVRWMGTQARRPAFMLSGSAVGYYGIQPQSQSNELLEDAPAQPIFMSELCQAWEAAAREAVPLGVRVEAMRFGLVLGKDGGSLPALLLPIKLGLGGPLAGGRQWMSWIHIEDLLRAMAHLWRRAEGEAVAPAFTAWNFTAPGAQRQADFSRSAASVLHRPSFFPTPGLPLRIALGEQADLLLEGQRVAPARLLATGFDFRFAQSREALRDLCGHG